MPGCAVQKWVSVAQCSVGMCGETTRHFSTRMREHSVSDTDVLFIMLYMAVPTFKSAYQNPKCANIHNECHWAKCNTRVQGKPICGHDIWASYNFDILAWKSFSALSPQNYISYGVSVMWNQSKIFPINNTCLGKWKTEFPSQTANLVASYYWTWLYLHIAMCILVVLIYTVQGAPIYMYTCTVQGAPIYMYTCTNPCKSIYISKATVQ